MHNEYIDDTSSNNHEGRHYQHNMHHIQMQLWFRQYLFLHNEYLSWLVASIINSFVCSIKEALTTDLLNL
ncbi:hypothetical protein KSZ_75470 [Dictyobacter formicarum]|uniref:Uncharacterized protein n=1 Tax=Dictyobacter formicarum TaxID=2778368 RepID=A0ABQ3VUW0_9CHLR|nr:hypothetical protein KSZ_75470 [Dictyobacter formicarum]